MFWWVVLHVPCSGVPGLEDLDLVLQGDGDREVIGWEVVGILFSNILSFCV